MASQLSTAASELASLHRLTKPIQTRPFPTPSTVALFLSNVRLLNLDKRPDWPDVTVKTFDTKDAAQNQKKRIACVEWILFRLFQIMDPAMTKEKLQPFFPPLEPLQSINLRAALLRCFNDLKKTGVLGREAVVRKTMLDECKGDRFEELLLMFSALALRKKMQAAHSSRVLPVAQRLGLADSISPADSVTLLPLTLAHRTSLSGALRRRAETKKLLGSFHRAMKDERRDVQHRREQIKASQSLLPEGVNDQTAFVEASEQLLRAFVLSPVDKHSIGTYDDVVTFFHHTGRLPTNATEKTLLERMELIATEQDIRLKMWNNRNREMKDSTTPTSDAEPPTQLAPSAIEKAKQDILTRHGGLQLDQSDDVPLKSTSSHHNPAYGGILDDMKREISSITKARRQGRKMLRGAKRPQNGRDFAQPSHNPKFQAPIRFDRPGQRRNLGLDPEQGKLDLFSPLKSFGRAIDGDKQDSAYGSAGHLSDTAMDGDVSLPDLETADVPSTTMASPAEVNANLDQRGNDDDEHSARYTDLASSTSGRSTNLTLAERALESMSLSHRASASLLPATLIPRFDAKEPAKPTPISSSFDRSISLADRTLETLNSTTSAFFSETTTLRRSRTERSSPSFPVNQFETPRKSRSISYHVEPPNTDVADSVVIPSMSNREETTPNANLFSEDAEYASVFKSRPKIAVSPVLSPIAFDSVSGFDSSGASRAGGFDQRLDSSPLGAFGGRGQGGRGGR
ncbi:hypothetical protein AAFC00_004636 [Neodothiora populina]|uniref:HAUS augmin-like complex subunit 6 N-terminal domain-containing protein n=1 Tax=Neodothiora populina TaxID=2781224 RepID=A0ABR3P2N6_9PEZI